jgi:hypothetical protein
MSISGFAAPGRCVNGRAMDNPAQALEDARRAGIDLSLLDANLALPVKERWRQHDEALGLALKLEQAGLNRDAKLRPTAAKAD